MAVYQEVEAVINSIPAAAPFSMTRAKEPFSFDLQPSTEADRVYFVRGALVEAQGYLGMHQAERHAIEVWMARKVKRNAQGAYESLQADCSSMIAALARIHQSSPVDFFVEEDVLRSEVENPAEEADFLIAKVEAIVNFDRAL